MCVCFLASGVRPSHHASCPESMRIGWCRTSGRSIIATCYNFGNEFCTIFVQVLYDFKQEFNTILIQVPYDLLLFSIIFYTIFIRFSHDFYLTVKTLLRGSGDDQSRNPGYSSHAGAHAGYPGSELPPYHSNGTPGPPGAGPYGPGPDGRLNGAVSPANLAAVAGAWCWRLPTDDAHDLI